MYILYVTQVVAGEANAYQLEDLFHCSTVNVTELLAQPVHLDLHFGRMIYRHRENHERE